MKKIATLATVLLIGSVVGPTAFAQTTTAPNSGAGVPGLPGNKSGPAVRPGEQPNVRPDQSNVPGLPGSKSGPAQVSPNRMQRAQGNEEEDEDQGGFFRHHPGMMEMMERGYGHHGGHEARGDARICDGEFSLGAQRHPPSARVGQSLPTEIGDVVQHRLRVHRVFRYVSLFN
jgi:hypothetical protein